MLNVPEASITIVKRWEGFSAEPYLCPAGVPTIGYGTVIASMSHPSVTREQATVLLLDGRNGLRNCVAAAYRYSHGLFYEPEYRVAAVASFIYNLGSGAYQASTLRRRINQKDWIDAERQFHRWVNAGGRKLAGLVARRADEAALFTGAGNA